MNKRERILGLDLGTNSIGWAIVEIDHESRTVCIIALGSRILPMNAGEISKFENGGKLQSSASKKTDFKSKRKNRERFLLRRDRLHCVLNLLGALPEHYKMDIDFLTENGKRNGKFKKDKEPKLPYFVSEDGRSHFFFNNSYEEMLCEFKLANPDLFDNKNTKNKFNIPYDWTLYYLRKKALNQKISKEELAWVIMSFLQKRGYQKIIGIDEKEQKEGELVEYIKAKVISVEDIRKKTTEGLNTYHIKLEDEYGNMVFEYDEFSKCKISNVNDFKQLEIITTFDNDGGDNVKNICYKINELKSLKIEDVVNIYDNVKDEIKYNILLSTGWTFEYLSQFRPSFTGDNIDLIISTSFSKDGILQKRIIKLPQKKEKDLKEKDSWELNKIKTETSIQSFNLENNSIGVASFIYDSLISNPTLKVRGGLVSTIEREFYEEELTAILKKQKEYHSELRDENKYYDALMMLYPNNERHRKTLLNRDFTTLLGEDVIFYQRDMKSKKSLISRCKYEYTKYKKEGKEIKEPLRCIAKSNPLYQEFRLWHFIKCLRIIQKEQIDENGEILVNVDVTDNVLTIPTKEELFDFLNGRQYITQNVLLRKLNLDDRTYKWNYDDDHRGICNETRYDFILRLKRIKGLDYKALLDSKHIIKQGNVTTSLDGCYLLWNFFYSVKKKRERLKGLPKLVEKLINNAGIEISYKDAVVEMLKTVPAYRNDYGGYSEKAIKKLLPLMRIGKYWSREGVENLEFVESIKPEVLYKEGINGEIDDLQGIGVSSACYMVYGWFSEVGEVTKWSQPWHIKEYLEKELKNEKLNNPVVEKVLRETLMIVHDIRVNWGNVVGKTGDGENIYEKYFDKINIEIGTSLKKNNKAKERDNKKRKENRLANERASALLKELKVLYPQACIKESSLSHKEKIKLFEFGAIDSIKYDKDEKEYSFVSEESGYENFTKKSLKQLLKTEVSKIGKKDLKRYCLWLEQRYVSPYTGDPISLSNLFDREKYQIDHIFPQERVTLNTSCNKVICEAVVNQAKGAMTGYEFILKSNGKVKYKGRDILLLTPQQYVEKVKSLIADKDKQEILLSKDIPDSFGNNQLNNSRYVAKVAMKLLSNIVRDECETDFKSKNVLVVSGGVTSILRQDWLLNEAWNDLIKPRFSRMRDLTGDNSYMEERVINGHSITVPVIPNKKGVDKKRIDHRHHALDALVVALVTSNHISYINNVSALNVNNERKQERRDLKTKYMIKRKFDDGSSGCHFLPPMQYKDGGEIITYKYAYKNVKPQKTIKDVALKALNDTIVTFKQNNRVLRQRVNLIQHPDSKDGLKEKEITLKDHYSVRQSLHQQTFYGKRSIKPVKIEEAVCKHNKIVKKRIRNLIELYKKQGMGVDEIISILKPYDDVVNIYEECAVTQWSHSLEYLATITDKDENKKNSKSEKSAIECEIECIADITIQKILKKHLARYDSEFIPVYEALNYYDDVVTEEHRGLVDDYKKGNLENKMKLVEVFVRGRNVKNRKQNPQLAFSAEGVNRMNKEIKELNNGNSHKPIYKVKVIQALGQKFAVAKDEKSHHVKKKQYVISDAGSNRYCGIYKNEGDSTKIYIPTLRETINAIQNAENLFPREHPDSNLYKLAFIISPLDFVYLPRKDEDADKIEIGSMDYTRLFVVNDFKQDTIYFRPYNVSIEIEEKEIDLQKSKDKLKGSCVCKTAVHDGVQIKNHCVPVKIDRLGQIVAVGEY